MKPRIYWTRYPKSRRGYWRVSHKPKRCLTHGANVAWDFAHRMCLSMNRDVERSLRKSGA